MLTRAINLVRNNLIDNVLLRAIFFVGFPSLGRSWESFSDFSSETTSCSFLVTDYLFSAEFSSILG